MSSLGRRKACALRLLSSSTDSRLAFQTTHFAKPSSRHFILPSHRMQQEQQSFSSLNTMQKYHWHQTTRLYSSDEEGGQTNSATGVIYNPDDDGKNHPVVYLFTKEGCTLCDKVKDVLYSVKEKYPHTLEAVDITDGDKTDWYSKYKYDIPVLHMNGIYWTKHRLTEDEAIEALEEIAVGKSFEERKGEPDAGEMERRMEERRKNE